MEISSVTHHACGTLDASRLRSWTSVRCSRMLGQYEYVDLDFVGSGA